jgi:hypothetical protein
LLCVGELAPLLGFACIATKSGASFPVWVDAVEKVFVIAGEA